MSEVSLAIGGRTYKVACADGEEEHVARLGATIDAKLQSMPQLSAQDAQNLLFGALLLADELDELRTAGQAASGGSTAAPDDNETQALRAELDELRQAEADMGAELQAAQAAEAELREELAAARSASEPSRATIGAAELAPALERFAELLESCADKLEGCAPAS